MLGQAVGETLAAEGLVKAIQVEPDLDAETPGAYIADEIVRQIGGAE